jgi:hypothetical protein
VSPTIFRPSWQAAAARAEKQFPDFTAHHLLHRTSKTLIVAGTCAGTPAVAKILTTGEGFWREKFAQEAAAYRAFADRTPPTRVPRLLAGGSEGGIMILQRVPGEQLHADRYPPALPLPRVRAAVETLGRLAAWNPAPGTFTQAWDYPERLDRYRAHGILDHDDHQALTRLLEQAGAEQHFAHGDPLPANIIINPHKDTTPDVTLVDWEFAGYYLPHHDQALLWVLLTHTPQARTLIEHHVDRGPQDAAAFTIGRAVILTRELRTHREALPARWARRRLTALEHDWALLRDTLHPRGEGAGRCA